MNNLKTPNTPNQQPRKAPQRTPEQIQAMRQRFFNWLMAAGLIIATVGQPWRNTNAGQVDTKETIAQGKIDDINSDAADKQWKEKFGGTTGAFDAGWGEIAEGHEIDAAWDEIAEEQELDTNWEKIGKEQRTAEAIAKFGGTTGAFDAGWGEIAEGHEIDAGWDAIVAEHELDAGWDEAAA